MPDKKQSKSRQSNMELLRIISMFMVLMVHVDGASLGLPALDGNLGALDARDAWRLGVESLTIVGVNCFTLISGYFGIRLTWTGMGRYLYQCIFYAVGITSVAMLVWPLNVSWDRWLESWMVLSHTDLWYVPAYFGLMLLAPVLNRGVEGLKRREFAMCLGIFVLFNLWCGWWQGGKFNPTGYTLVQLIMMYMIGRYVRMHISASTLCSRRVVLWTLYAVSTLAIFIMSVYMQPLKAFAYNSPAVICASVALLAAFSTLSFTSRAVNYIARSAFAVYLLHKAPVVWKSVMKPTVTDMWAHSSLGVFTLKALGMCLAVYAAAMVIDAVRRYADPFSRIKK